MGGDHGRGGHRHGHGKGERHAHPHGDGEHGHAHGTGLAHTHAEVDPTLAASREGVRAVVWSLVWMALTAVVQLVIVWYSGSAALLSDTLHNFGDALTALPLWFAFVIARKAGNRTYPYGYGRVEDLGGLFIFLVILASAIAAGYVAIDRLLHPQPISHVWVVLAGGLVGFLGNEAVAIYRIRTGRRIHSVALEADGHHARVDGWTSLAVVAGAIGVLLGFPLADPIAGLVLTALILRVVWDAGRMVFGRMLDRVDPDLIPQVEKIAAGVPGVLGVNDPRVRWVGHRLRAEVSITVAGGWTVEQGHAVAVQVRHRLVHELPHLMDAVIHVDPDSAAGEAHHAIARHEHDGLAAHAH